MTNVTNGNPDLSPLQLLTRDIIDDLRCSHTEEQRDEILYTLWETYKSWDHIEDAQALLSALTNAAYKIKEAKTFNDLQSVSKNLEEAPGIYLESTGIPDLSPLENLTHRTADNMQHLETNKRKYQIISTLRKTITSWRHIKEAEPLVSALTNAANRVEKAEIRQHLEDAAAMLEETLENQKKLDTIAA